MFYMRIYLAFKKTFSIWPCPRGKGLSVDGVQSCLENVKEKQTTIAHLRALEEGLGKFLKLIEASFNAKVIAVSEQIKKCIGIKLSPSMYVM